MDNQTPASAPDAASADQPPGGPGVSHIDPADPAAAYYELLAHLRRPLTLREIMIRPVRTGYIGNDLTPPANLPPSAASLYPDVVVGTVTIEGPAGPLRCQTYALPGASGRPMLLYVHGGGFTVGSSEDTAYITSRMAQDAGVVVVSVNYRLAPEWPFPAALEDCLAAFRWMRTRGATIGGDPERIAVGGDSAGGNIAAALPVATRDTGLAGPRAALLLCPITDFEVERHPSFERLAPLGIIYDTAFVGYVRGAYVVHRRLWDHPHVSPARADLSGFPPTLVVSGEADPMIDDNRAFVARLVAAGVPVEHFVRAAMPHGYYFFPHLLAQGDEALAAASTFLRAALG
jgi:acetyl esterase